VEIGYESHRILSNYFKDANAILNVPPEIGLHTGLSAIRTVVWQSECLSSYI